MLSIVWKHTWDVTGRLESLTDQHQSQDAQHHILDAGRTPRQQRELSPRSMGKNTRGWKWGYTSYVFSL